MKTLLAATLPLLLLATSCTTLSNRRDLYNPNDGDDRPYHQQLDRVNREGAHASWWPLNSKSLQSGRAAYLEDEG